MNIRTMVESDLDRILTCLETPTVNTSTPQRFTELLASGSYRPGWTWVAEDGDRLLGLAVWWGFAQGDGPLAVDALYADPSVVDPVPLWTELLRAVTGRWDPAAEPPEYHVFLAPDWRSDPAVVAQLEPRLAAAAGAGLSETVERLRYEWTPAAGVPERSTRLEFRPEPDDEAFVDVFRRVIEGTLDASSSAAAVRTGAEGAAREEVAMYRSMRGDRSWWRLAYDASGELVGFALPSANDGGPVVGYLGVLPEHRGHGYAADLLDEITIALAETGAQRIAADTDLANAPMAATFDRAGYRNFATRLVATTPPT